MENKFISEKTNIEITYLKDTDVLTFTIKVDEDSKVFLEFDFDCLILTKQENEVILIVPLKNLISLSTSNVG